MAQSGPIIPPEKDKKREQTLVLLIRLFSLAFCLAFWCGVYELFKVIFH